MRSTTHTIRKYIDAVKFSFQIHILWIYFFVTFNCIWHTVLSIFVANRNSSKVFLTIKYFKLCLLGVPTPVSKSNEATRQGKRCVQKKNPLESMHFCESFHTWYIGKVWIVLEKCYFHQISTSKFTLERGYHHHQQARWFTLNFQTLTSPFSD